MKIIGIIVVLALIAASVFLAGSDVDVKGGEMPEVDVNTSADAGNLPEYEVRKTKEGNLPSVDIDVDAVKGALPNVDVTMPDVKTKTKTIEVPVGVSVDAAEGSAIDEAQEMDVDVDVEHTEDAK